MKVGGMLPLQKLARFKLELAEAVFSFKLTMNRSENYGTSKPFTYL